MIYYRHVQRNIFCLGDKKAVSCVHYYKLVELLTKFITERGKSLPRRMTGLTSKQQRDLTWAVKRARIVALLPFVNPEG